MQDTPNHENAHKSNLKSNSKAWIICENYQEPQPPLFPWLSQVSLPNNRLLTKSKYLRQFNEASHRWRINFAVKYQFPRLKKQSMSWRRLNRFCHEPMVQRLMDVHQSRCRAIRHCVLNMIENRNSIIIVISLPRSSKFILCILTNREWAKQKKKVNEKRAGNREKEMLKSGAAIQSLFYERIDDVEFVCMKNDTNVHHLREMIYRHNLRRRLDFIFIASENTV